MLGPSVLVVVEDAVSVDDPAYVSRAVVSEGEGWVGGWDCTSHCGDALMVRLIF